MKPIVIDTMCSVACERGIYPELEAFMNKDYARDRAEYDEATKIPEFLHLNDDEQRQLSDWAADVHTHGEDQGFRDGFRLAARLMLEILQDPGTGGGT